jgi:hypothetical protein
MRTGYTDNNGKYHPPINFLNAMGEELLLPDKVYRDAELIRRCLILSSGFLKGAVFILSANERGNH